MGSEPNSILLLRLSLSLIEAGRAGARSGPDVESLVERHHRYLLALLEYKTGDSELARDLLQDTYVAFLGAVLGGGDASRWSDDSKVRNYLITIALNKVRDHYRTARRRSTVTATFRSGEELEERLQKAVSAEPTPENELANFEERTRLHGITRYAMERLPDRDRMALYLKFTRGMDNAAISKELGLGVKAVESLLFRAKRRFKKEFERLDVEAE